MKINGLIKFILFASMAIFSMTTTFAVAPDTYPFTSASDATRFDSLTKEIRCVVCQNQSIADSSAPLAKDLRGKIYNMVIEKKSDADIENFLVQRYGEFILLKPRINKLTALLWLFPFIGMFVTVIFLFFYVRRQKKCV